MNTYQKLPTPIIKESVFQLLGVLDAQPKDLHQHCQIIFDSHKDDIDLCYVCMFHVGEFKTNFILRYYPRFPENRMELLCRRTTKINELRYNLNVFCQDFGLNEESFSWIHPLACPKTHI